MYSSGSDVSLPLLKVVVTVTTTFQPDFPDFWGLFFRTLIVYVQLRLLRSYSHQSLMTFNTNLNTARVCNSHRLVTVSVKLTKKLKSTITCSSKLINYLANVNGVSVLLMYMAHCHSIKFNHSWLMVHLSHDSRQRNPLKDVDQPQTKLLVGL